MIDGLPKPNSRYAFVANGAAIAFSESNPVLADWLDYQSVKTAVDECIDNHPNKSTYRQVGNEYVYDTGLLSLSNGAGECYRVMLNEPYVAVQSICNMEHFNSVQNGVLRLGIYPLSHDFLATAGELGLNNADNNNGFKPLPVVLLDGYLRPYKVNMDDIGQVDVLLDLTGDKSQAIHICQTIGFNDTAMIFLSLQAAKEFLVSDKDVWSKHSKKITNNSPVPLVLNGKPITLSQDIGFLLLDDRYSTVKTASGGYQKLYTPSGIAVVAVRDIENPKRVVGWVTVAFRSLNDQIPAYASKWQNLLRLNTSTLYTDKQLNNDAQYMLLDDYFLNQIQRNKFGLYQVKYGRKPVTTYRDLWN